MKYLSIILAYCIGCLNVLPLAFGHVTKYESAARHSGYVAGKQDGQREVERRMDNGERCFIAAYNAEGGQRVGVACVTRNGVTAILGRG